MIEYVHIKVARKEWFDAGKPRDREIELEPKYKSMKA